MNRPTVLAMLTLTTLSLSGCANSEEAPLESTEDEARVKPKGLDDDSGRLAVRGIGAIANARLWVGGSNGAADKPLDFVMASPTQDFDYSLRTEGPHLTSSVGGKVTLRRGQQVTVATAGVKVDMRTPALPFGANQPKLWATDVNAQTVGLVVAQASDGTELGFVNPNERFAFTWGFFDGHVFKAGALNTITSTKMFANSGRMRATFAPLPVRELPDSDLCTSDPQTISVSGSRWENGAARSADLVAMRSDVLGFNPEVAAIYGAPTAPTLTYMTPCFGGIDVEFGSVGGAAKVNRLGRIDVDDVEVAQPGGGTEIRRGEYQIFDSGNRSRVRYVIRQNGSVGQILPTGTGVDVAPGTYKVVVTYTTNSGVRKTFEQMVTTP
jgi:hypothetical protein